MASPRSVLSMTLRSSSSRAFASRSPCAATNCTPRCTSNISCTPEKSGACQLTSRNAERKVRHALLEHARRCRASTGAQPRSVDTAARSLPRSAPASRAGMRAPVARGERIAPVLDGLRPAAADAGPPPCGPSAPSRRTGPGRRRDRRSAPRRARAGSPPRRRRPPACAGCRRSRSRSPAAPGRAPARPPSRPRSRRRSAAD